MLAAIGIILVVLVAVSAYYYSYAAPSPTVTNTTTVMQPVTLNGAGATFPFPLISKMSSEYNKLYPSVQVNYQSIGSGGGIRQFMVRTVDFAASDAPLTDTQFANVTGALHIPFTIGGVVPTYNLPGIASGLKFTGPILADIYLGKITKWNDPQLAALNPGVNLPDKDIIVVHRSDGSGTTFVWTNYLSDVSPEWKEKVGKSTSVNWPVGLGGKGNEGVAGIVTQNPNALGYNEFAYATINNIAFGAVQNAAGNFVLPTLESFTAAVNAASTTLPKGDENWSQVSIIDSTVTNKDASNAYPITSFSYFLLYKELNAIPGMDQDRAKSLVNFLWWTVHDGQNYAPALVYVPLSSTVVALDEATIRSITLNGQSVFQG
jgi:phosphate ABC transporter phosphate-binding protein